MPDHHRHQPIADRVGRADRRLPISQHAPKDAAAQLFGHRPRLPLEMIVELMALIEIPAPNRD
jgi:hypothetical protein